MKIRIIIFSLLIAWVSRASFEVRSVPQHVSNVGKAVVKISPPARLPATINDSTSQNQPEEFIDYVLEIQVQADKDHGVFVSLDDSEAKFRETLEEFGLSYNTGDPVLIDYLNVHSDNSKEAIEWSKAVAKYRYATNDDEKLELIKELIDSVIAKGDFQRTHDVIDCENGQIEFDNFEEQERIMISFHASVSNSIDRLDGAYSRQEGNERVNSIYSGLNKLGQLHKKEVHGVLYAWTRDSQEIESCDFSIPY